jgi:hypothetical protein
MHTLDVRQAGGIGKCCQDVFTFEVSIVFQHLFGGHATREKFQHGFHGITQAADAGLAVADAGVEGDAI